MSINFKRPSLRSKNTLIVLTIIGFIIIGISPFLEIKIQGNEVDFSSGFLSSKEIPELITIQNNTLISVSNPFTQGMKATQTLGVIITAYSSSVWQTDDTPFITAAGTRVRDGIVANNYLPLGTKIRIPQLFGDKVFVVEDRMHWTKGNYHIDIWFPDYLQAKSFGAKRTYVEILEN